MKKIKSLLFNNKNKLLIVISIIQFFCVILLFVRLAEIRAQLQWIEENSKYANTVLLNKDNTQLALKSIDDNLSIVYFQIDKLKSELIPLQIIVLILVLVMYALNRKTHTVE